MGTLCFSYSSNSRRRTPSVALNKLLEGVPHIPLDEFAPDTAVQPRFWRTCLAVPRAILTRPDHPPVFGARRATTSISLFQGMIPSDTLNLRGGNVGAIAQAVGERGVDLGAGVQIGTDGGESILLLDPDERPILFDTTPPERLYAN